MNAFIDLTGEEQILELVTYTAELLKDEKFKDTCQSKISNGQATEVLSDLIKHSKVYYTGSKDIGSILNSITRLLCCVREDTHALVKTMAEAVSDPTITDHVKARMKVLGNLFNNLEPTSPARFDTYIALLNLAGNTGNLKSVQVTFSKLDAWIVEWQLSKENQMVLYETLYRITYKHQYSEQSSTFLTKLVECYDSEDAASMKACAAHATKLIALSLSDPDLFNMDYVLKLQAVQKLKSEKCYELFTILQSGDLAKYKSWMKINSSTVEELGLNQEELLRKIRLISLAYVCAASETVEFASIAKALDIEDDEVEMWIIDVIRVGLVEAKVDQVNKKVFVSLSKMKKFDQSQWEDLQSQLTSWNKNLAQCKRVMTTVKLQIDNAAKAARMGR